MTRHLKRKAVPGTWPIEKKKNMYVTRPNPGAHRLEEGMPLGVFLKEVFSYAKTGREVRHILNNMNVLVDGRKRKDDAFQVGLFDVVEFTDTEERYRITLNTKGKIDVLKIEKSEAGVKPCRIIGKGKVSGKTQLNLSDGRNIIVEKDGYKTGDTLLIELPSQAIKKHFPLGKKAVIFLTGGKFKGHLGTVEGILGQRLMYKTEAGEAAETSKKYGFVVGEEKPALAVIKKEG